MLAAGMKPEPVSARAAELLRAFRTGGPIGYQQKIDDDILKQSEQGMRVQPLRLAGVYGRACDKEKTLEWIQKAYEERYNLTLLNYGSWKKCLGQDPRFLDMLKRIGLPN